MATAEYASERDICWNGTDVLLAGRVGLAYWHVFLLSRMSIFHGFSELQNTKLGQIVAVVVETSLVMKDLTRRHTYQSPNFVDVHSPLSRTLPRVVARLRLQYACYICLHILASVSFDARRGPVLTLTIHVRFSFTCFDGPFVTICE